MRDKTNYPCITYGTQLSTISSRSVHLFGHVYCNSSFPSSRQFLFVSFVAQLWQVRTLNVASKLGRFSLFIVAPNWAGSACEARLACISSAHPQSTSGFVLSYLSDSIRLVGTSSGHQSASRLVPLGRSSSWPGLGRFSTPKAGFPLLLTQCLG